VNLPVLPAHPDCTLCPMHEHANNVGIPTHHMLESLDPGPEVPAVVFIGQNPGREEDGAPAPGEPFIGETGSFMREVYIEGLNLYERCSVYLTNALRCGPISITSAGLFNACWSYTEYDLITIAETHHDVVPIIVFVSAPAVKSFFWNVCHERIAQRDSFGMQGCLRTLPDTDVVYRIYSTYHPAKVYRQNKYILPTRDHLTLLSSNVMWPWAMERAMRRRPSVVAAGSLMMFTVSSLTAESLASAARMSCE